MSCSTSSCSTSPTQTLFDKGIQELQQQRQSEKLQAARQQETEQPLVAALEDAAGIGGQSSGPKEENKGSLFDAYA